MYIYITEKLIELKKKTDVYFKQVYRYSQFAHIMIQPYIKTESYTKSHIATENLTHFPS